MWEKFSGVGDKVMMTEGYCFFTNISLAMFPEETLKASHASTNIEFIWQGKTLSYHTSASRTALNHCNGNSVSHLYHY